MKNADMPAMPMDKSIDTHQQWEYLTAGGRFIPVNGLTKRETIAMHQSSRGFECDVMFLGDFIGRNVDIQCPIDRLIASIEADAKIKVMMADALLKELEK